MRSLRVRVPLLAMAVLAPASSIAALIAHTLLVSAGYARLDDVLEREQRSFQQSIANIIERVDTRRDAPRVTARERRCASTCARRRAPRRT